LDLPLEKHMQKIQRAAPLKTRVSEELQ
jgi:hypothetical protein